jgi:hypothetical protein
VTPEAPLLQVLAGCDACPPDPPPPKDQLFAVVDGRRFCSRHWHEAGHPWPRRVGTVDEVHEAELRTRERMTARGGTDRHLVRAGKT